MRETMTMEEFNEILNDEYTKTIKYITRFGRNGHKYVWEIKNLTKEQCLSIINKYGVDEISDTTFWLLTY